MSERRVWGAVLAALAWTVLGSLAGAAQETVERTDRVREVLAPRRFVVELGHEDGVEVGDPARLERGDRRPIVGRVVAVEGHRATIQLTGLPGRAELELNFPWAAPSASHKTDLRRLYISHCV